MIWQFWTIVDLARIFSPIWSIPYWLVWTRNRNIIKIEHVKYRLWSRSSLFCFDKGGKNLTKKDDLVGPSWIIRLMDLFPFNLLSGSDIRCSKMCEGLHSELSSSFFPTKGSTSTYRKGLTAVSKVWEGFKNCISLDWSNKNRTLEFPISDFPIIIVYR